MLEPLKGKETQFLALSFRGIAFKSGTQNYFCSELHVTLKMATKKSCQ